MWPPADLLGLFWGSAVALLVTRTLLLLLTFLCLLSSPLHLLSFTTLILRFIEGSFINTWICFSEFLAYSTELLLLVHTSFYFLIICSFCLVFKSTNTLSAAC
ncbi:hypothetical protein ATANTOWER_026836 [Ataeniobius toweri]|uniref:Uncharacterized protein n=1 Tax=Ataeniobius toweri TaxID=208326 RepID=A0ABU7BJR2_9TELE|nr:hypothetical protein [Ataeniobius toweri]